MPKNTAPKGGRPSRNFDPRYGAKKTSFRDRHAGGRGGSDAPRRGESDDAYAPRGAGSKSPKHRGYRAPEPTERGPKRRWTEQERVGRNESRSIRDHAGRGDARPARDDRGQGRGFSRDDRAQGARRDDRGFAGRRDDRGFEGRRDDRGFERRDDRGAQGRGFQGRRDDRGFDNRRDDRGSQDRGFQGRREDRGFEGRRDDRGAQDRGFQGRRDDRGFEGRRDDRGSQGRGFQGRRDDRGFDNRRDGRGSQDRGFQGRRDDRGFDNRRDDRGSDNRRDDRGFGRRDDRQRDDRAGSSERRDTRSYVGRDSARPEHRGGFGSRDAGRREQHHRRDDRFESRGQSDRRDDRRQGDRFERGGRGESIRAPRPSRADWNPQAKAQTEDVVHERLKAKAVEATVTEGLTFAELGLGSNIVEVLANMGAASPFPIQAASIPAVLEGSDVLGRGRTGSGKTIAFGAPLVERVLRAQAGKKREFGRSPQALILAPTRELALQIDATVQPIARSVGLFTTQIYGGVPQGRQVGALKKGVDIVIGTPGRIEDLLEQGKLDLSDCRIAVLDEADHMCELGFVEPVQRILRKTADGSQKLLFSATLDREVASLVEEFLVEPAVYEVAGEDQTTGTIDHRVLVIDHREKGEILTSLVDRDGKTLVFARTRAYAEMLAEEFADAGIPAVSLHGDLNQAKRTRNLQKLTDGKVQVLVATDVAARGIHVDDIDLVVQADAPDEYKTYLHRAGRTGRAGSEGRVVTLITRQRQRRMTELLDRAEIDAPFESARAGDEVIEEIAGRVPTADELTA